LVGSGSTLGPGLGSTFACLTGWPFVLAGSPLHPIITSDVSETSANTHAIRFQVIFVVPFPAL